MLLRLRCWWWTRARLIGLVRAHAAERRRLRQRVLHAMAEAEASRAVAVGRHAEAARTARELARTQDEIERLKVLLGRALTRGGADVPR